MGVEPATSAYGYRFSLTAADSCVFKKYQLALKGESKGEGLSALMQCNMNIKDKGNLRFQEKLLDVILFGGKSQGFN